ncbi:MAG: DUF3108 domain-containing protein [Gammaproteobacteria bacterium]|nr:DUF3108 domain-containing protein [Gammaproteobacteria bacterium]
MRYLILLTLYILLQSVALAAPIKDFTANYNLYHNEMYIGQSTRNLTTQNKLLTFTSVAKTAGIAAWFVNMTITETSKLRFTDNRLHFISYHYNEDKNGKNKSYQLHLDSPHKLYNSYTKKHYPAVDNMHDILGFTVAIMHELQTGNREIKYTIAEKKKLKTYTLKLLKQENLTTDKGTISTLKMEHYDPDTKRRFTFWCAENLGFLPIRILNINEKGDENLINLTHLNQKAINLHLNLSNEESD